MMSLTEVSVIDSVKRQFKFKLRSYIGAFTTLVAVQLIALLFSSSGTGSMGSGSESYSINVSYYSSDLVIMFTMLWSFITAILITTKSYRYEDFMFVTSRLTSGLANVVFLLISSVIGGLFSVLAGYVQKVYLLYLSDSMNLLNAAPSISEIVVGILGAIFYMILFSALGYFVGMLTQFHKLFIILVPAYFFGSLFMSAKNDEEGLITKLFNFFVEETSLLVFIGKVLLVAATLFYGSYLLSKRLEVRK
ncbi:hypothetical protein FZW96_03300 [Bacillus sp. BGMRC 2118]|nr:hypothetical protein FZW96_03300 [Bacillus sp. BGMRC 2118]